MTNVDQFESVFRSSVKDVYQHNEIQIQSVVLLTDLDSDQAERMRVQVVKFLSVLEKDQPIAWKVYTGQEFESTEDVLSIVKKDQPDLICTYRNLHSEAWKFPHSLGEHLDVLCQKTDVPVLVLPHPVADYAAEHAMEKLTVSMAVTDHLSNDHRLVNYAAKFIENGGSLCLMHIENEVSFDYFMDAVSKISTIDTDDARVKIKKQLLKGPSEYINSCSNVLNSVGRSIKIESLVTFGHHLSEYINRIEEHHVDLLVMRAKDEDQLAMHGMAYPIAVELRQIPILLI